MVCLYPGGWEALGRFPPANVVAPAVEFALASRERKPAACPDCLRLDVLTPLPRLRFRAPAASSADGRVLGTSLTPVF